MLRRRLLAPRRARRLLHARSPLSCHPERSEGSAFRLSPLRVLNFNGFNSRSPLPFNIPTFKPSNLQTTNLDAASSISPLFATLTENTRGGGYAIVNSFVAQTSVWALLRQPTWQSSEAKDPQELKNLAVRPVANHESQVAASVLFLPRVTGHQSQITKSCRIRTSPKRVRISFGIRTSKTQDLKPFRIRTYKKTPGGGGA
jgi:hypothetical protein